MKQNPIMILLSILLLGCSDPIAQENDAEETSIQQSEEKAQKTSVKTGFFEDRRVKEYLANMERSLNTMNLIYKRMSPDAAKMIKPVALPPEALDVARCIVKGIDEAGLQKTYDKGIELMEVYLSYVEDTPSLTLATVTEDETFNEMLEEFQSPEQEEINQISKECGSVELNGRLVKESGVMEAMKMAMDQDQP